MYNKLLSTIQNVNNMKFYFIIILVLLILIDYIYLVKLHKILI
jgi:hypothetical protein